MGEPRVVARAIARAALSGMASPVPPAVAIGATGAPARVQALLGSRASVPWSRRGAVAAAGLVAVVGVAGSTIQLHHLVALVAHACGLH